MDEIKTEELNSTLEATERLEETVERARDIIDPSELKVSEDDMNVNLNGTTLEPQVTTEYETEEVIHHGMR